MKHIQAERYVQPIPEWVERTEWVKREAAKLSTPDPFIPVEELEVPPTLH